MLTKECATQGTALNALRELLRAKGLEPVFKNWDATYREPAHYEQVNS